MTKVYAWSMKGQVTIGITPLKRGENLTLIGALAKKRSLRKFYS